jgi:hypothetical protein
MEPEMWVSWCDDGVTIICQREECMEGGYWWQKVIDEPYRLQPEDLAAAMLAHTETHPTSHKKPSLSPADEAEMKRGRSFHSSLCMKKWWAPCCCGVSR